MQVAEARGLKRSLEEFLSPSDMMDHEIISFWIDDDQPEATPQSAPDASPRPQQNQAACGVLYVIPAGPG